jgi:hypothetical protein
MYGKDNEVLSGAFQSLYTPTTISLHPISFRTQLVHLFSSITKVAGSTSFTLIKSAQCRKNVSECLRSTNSSTGTQNTEDQALRVWFGLKLDLSCGLLIGGGADMT